MYRLELRIDLLPTNQLNSRAHWSKRLKESQLWDNQIWYHTTGKRPPKPLQRAKLTLVRHSHAPSDWDNLAATWKHPVDALVTAGILADDTWKVIGMPEIRWEKAPQKCGYVTICVEELGLD